MCENCDPYVVMRGYARIINGRLVMGSFTQDPKYAKKSSYKLVEVVIKDCEVQSFVIVSTTTTTTTTLPVGVFDAIFDSIFG